MAQQLDSGLSLCLLNWGVNQPLGLSCSPAQKEKNINDSVPLYLKLLLLPTDTFPKAPVVDEEHWGVRVVSHWAVWDLLGKQQRLMTHGSPRQAAGFAQLHHRRKQIVSLEGQGGKPEACLGSLET